MPVILEFEFMDGTKELIRIPAEIWSTDNYNVTKVFSFDKVVKSLVLDPFLETADVDTYNNSWPRSEKPSRFELFKDSHKSKNPMQEAGE